jgi:hypothetical protein
MCFRWEFSAATYFRTVAFSCFLIAALPVAVGVGLAEGLDDWLNVAVAGLDGLGDPLDSERGWVLPPQPAASTASAASISAGRPIVARRPGNSTRAR